MPSIEFILIGVLAVLLVLFVALVADRLKGKRDEHHQH